MTTLEAINVMMRAAGLPPVSATDTGANNPAGWAETILDDHNLEIQSEGWACNTDYNITITADGSDQYPVPASSVLQIRPVFESASLQLTIRDGLIYDMVENTDEFPNHATLRINRVNLLAFDELPVRLSRYIARSAAVEFQRVVKRGTTDDAMLVQQASKARVKALQESSDQKRLSVTQSRHVQRVRGDRRQYPENT